MVTPSAVRLKPLLNMEVVARLLSNNYADAMPLGRRGCAAQLYCHKPENLSATTHKLLQLLVMRTFNHLHHTGKACMQQLGSERRSCALHYLLEQIASIREVSDLQLKLFSCQWP